MVQEQLYNIANKKTREGYTRQRVVNRLIRIINQGYKKSLIQMNEAFQYQNN